MYPVPLAQGSGPYAAIGAIGDNNRPLLPGSWASLLFRSEGRPSCLGSGLQLPIILGKQTRILSPFNLRMYGIGQRLIASFQCGIELARLSSLRLGVARIAARHVAELDDQAELRCWVSLAFFPAAACFHRPLRHPG